MTLQDVTTALSDGNLGVAPEDTDRIGLLVGACSAGAANTLIPINSPDGAAALGFGPLAEAARLMTELGGRPFYALPVTTSAGTNGTVSSPGGPAVTLTGTPLDGYEGQVKITVGGAVGTAKFQVSLDNGETWSDEITTAATYPVPNSGLTLNFAAGTYVAAQVYSWTSVAPSFSTVQLNTALDVALNDQREFGWAYVVGTATGADDAAKSSACAAIAAAAGTKAGTGFTSKAKFFRIFVEAPNVADAALITAFASFVDQRVGILVGFGKVLSPLTGRKHIVNGARVVLGRFARKPIGKDPSQTLAEEGTGPLPSALLTISRDERLTPGLDSLKFTTLRTYIGLKGFFVTNFWLMAATGSDTKYVQHGQCLDNACKVLRSKAILYLSRDLDTKTDDTGRLTEGQAAAIDTDCDSAVRASLVTPRHVQDVGVVTNRLDDIISTEKLNIALSIVPKGYPKAIGLTVGFSKKINKPQ